MRAEEIKFVVTILSFPLTILAFILLQVQSGKCNLSLKFQVQKPCSNFYGREEFLEQFHDSIQKSRLQTPNTTTQSLSRPQQFHIKVITGEGGTGKTELVKKYIERYGHLYDNVIWLDAGAEETLTQSFLLLAHDPSVEIDLTKKVEGLTSEIDKPIKEIVQEIYLKLSHGASLVVFDDVTMTSRANENLMEGFLPLRVPAPLKQPIVILISKNFEDWRGGGDEQEQELEFFSLDSFTHMENIGFILNQLKLGYEYPGPKFGEEAKELGELLGGIPLAIQLAVAYMKEAEVKMMDYIQLYTETDALRRTEMKPEDYQWNPIATAWIATRSKLEESPEGVAGVEILETLAFFMPSEVIPQLFVFALTSNSNHVEGSLEWQFFMECLNLLEKYTLIKKNGGEIENGRQIQIVVMDNLRMDWTENLKILLDRAHKFMTQVVSNVSRDAEDKKKAQNSNLNSTRAGKYLKNMEILTEKTSQIFTSDVMDAHLKLYEYKPKIALMYEILGERQESKRVLKKLFQELREIIQINFKQRPTDQETLIEIVFENIFHSNSNLAPFIQTIYETSQSILTADLNPAIIALFQKIAASFLNQKQFRESLEIYRRIYEIQTDSMEGENSKSLMTLHDIALTLMESGQLDQASRIYFDIYDNEKSDGWVDPQKFIPAKNLARKLAQEKHFENSLDLLEMFLEIQEAAYGRNHTETLLTLRDIADFYLGEFNFDAALRILTQIYETYQYRFGPSDPLSLESKQKLAQCHLSLENFENSLQLFQQIYETKKKLYGNNNETCASLEDVADVKLRQKELRKALELYRQIFKIRTEILGPSHLGTLTTFEKIGLVYIGQNQISEALKTFKQIQKARETEIQTETETEIDKDSQGSMTLALTLSIQNDGDSRRKALKMIRELLPQDDEGPIKFLEQISLVVTPKNFEKILNFLNSLYQIQMEIFPGSPQVIQTLDKMSKMSATQGNLDSIKWAEKSLELAKQKYGQFHPKTLTSLQTLAEVNALFEHHQETFRLISAMYTMSQKIFGSLNWQTLKILRNLAKTHETKKDYTKFVSALEEILELRKKAVERKRKVTDPDQDIEVISAQNDLAWGLFLERKFEDSLKLFVKVYEKRSQVLGPIHNSTLESYEKVADLLAEMGGNDEAKTAYKKLLSLKKKTMGESHNQTLSIQFKLARVYEAEKSYRDALRSLKISCAKQITQLGESYPKTITCEQDLARLYYLSGNVSEALKISWKILKNRRKLLGENHDETLRAKIILADLYIAKKEYDHAEDLYEDVYKKKVKLLGEKHPETMAILEKIAIMTNNEVKNYPEALDLYTEIYEYKKSRLGEENLETMKYLEIIAQVKHNLKDFEGSMDISRKIYKVRSKLIGENHEDSLQALKNIAAILCEIGQVKGKDGGLKLFEKILKVKRMTLGRYHEETKNVQKIVDEIKERLAAEEKAIEESKQPKFKVQKVDL